MKNTFKIIAIFFALVLTTSATAQNNDNGLIGRAIGAAQECFGNGLNDIEVNGSVETVGICFVSGEIKRVTLYATPKCHQQPCIMSRYMVHIVATVDFDCDGNLIAVNCGGTPSL